jgi:hypothetical protein
VQLKTLIARLALAHHMIQNEFHFSLPARKASQENIVLPEKPRNIFQCSLVINGRDTI